MTNFFAGLEDRRINRTRRHQLDRHCRGGAAWRHQWVQIEKFGNNGRAWLETFPELRNGIPVHDAFYRVFAQLDSACFMKTRAQRTQNL